MGESQNRITQFFKSQKNIDCVNVAVHTPTVSDFYKNIAKTNECKSKTCECLRIKLKNQLELEKERLMQVEKALSTCLSIIDLKNEKIEQVTKKSELSTPPKRKSNSKELFIGHAKKISSDDLAKLRSFTKEMRDDSSFVLEAVRSLYKHNIDDLKGMNLSMNKLRTDFLDG